MDRQEILDSVELTGKKCRHDIPFYAYGDNEAACVMDGILSGIEDDLSKLHRRISETMNFEFGSFAKLWRIEVYDKGEQVDPFNDYIWRGVAMGWAIAKGMSVEQAREFVNHLDILNLL